MSPSTAYPAGRYSYGYQVPKVRASKSANSGTIGTTETAVTFDVEHYDFGSMHAASDSSFTAPVAGVYHYDATVSIYGASSGMWILAYKNPGADLIDAIRAPAFGAASSSRANSGDVYLAAGESIYFTTSADSGASTIIIGGDDYNTHASMHLVADAAGQIIGPEAWQTISLSNASAYGGNTPAFRKLPDGTVEVRGEITLTTGASGTLIWTFPALYRPTMRSGFVLNIGQDGTLPVFDVYSNGQVLIGSRVGNTNAGLNLAPIRFPTT